MAEIPKDHREFIELLNEHKVKYVIVGGHAVAFHGYPRMTGDIDFLVERSTANARRLKSVMVAFGFESLKLRPRDLVEPNLVIQLGRPPNRIDITTTITGVSFEEAWAERVRVEWHGLLVNFISKAHLKKNKMLTGRAKDIADLGALD